MWPGPPLLTPQDEVDAHEASVARARERLAANRYTDPWERASDLALVETADDERPKAKTQEMLRDMMDSSRNPSLPHSVARDPPPPAAYEQMTDDAASSSALSDDGSTGGGTDQAEPPPDGPANKPPDRPANKPPNRPPAARVTAASSTASSAPSPAARVASPRRGEQRDTAGGGSGGADSNDEVGARLRAAEACKEEGNDFFRAGMAANAVESYERALIILGHLLAVRLTLLS